jgi:HEAT repeat protein
MTQMSAIDVNNVIRLAIADLEAGRWLDENRRGHVRALREAGAELTDLEPLLLAEDATRRAFAVEVLQVPKSEKERLAFLEFLRGMLRRERSNEAMVAIIQALNELTPDDRVDLVLPYVTSTDADVRQVTAVALGGSRDSRAVDALVALSSDTVDDVRNWAVFELGSMLGTPESGLFSSQALCDALAARLSDAHEETRAEAALGLALRGDLRSLPVVRAELERGTDWAHYVEAAYHLASPDLCEPLRELWSSLDESGKTFWESASDVSLSAAISRCCREGAPS